MRQDLEDTCRRMELQAAFEAGRRGRQMLEAAKRDATAKDLDKRSSAASEAVAKAARAAADRQTAVPSGAVGEPDVEDLINFSDQFFKKCSS